MFYNTQSKEESMNDEKAFATIERIGNFTLPKKEKIHNALVFKGIENPIAISRAYSFK